MLASIPYRKTVRVHSFAICSCSFFGRFGNLLLIAACANDARRALFNLVFACCFFPLLLLVSPKYVVDCFALSCLFAMVILLLLFPLNTANSHLSGFMLSSYSSAHSSHTFTARCNSFFVFASSMISSAYISQVIRSYSIVIPMSVALSFLSSFSGNRLKSSGELGDPCRTPFFTFHDFVLLPFKSRLLLSFAYMSLRSVMISCGNLSSSIMLKSFCLLILSNDFFKSIRHAKIFLFS